MKYAAAIAAALLAVAPALAEPPEIKASVKCETFSADMPDLLGAELQTGATMARTARYWLLPDGKLGNISYREGSPTAKWSREGDTLTFNHYNGEAFYIGKIAGDRVAGTVTSKDGAVLGEFQYMWCKPPPALN